MPGCFCKNNTPHTPRRKTSVSFNETVEIFVVMSRSEYTIRERKNCYFSAEYHQNMSLWLGAVTEGMSVSETRGIEAFLPSSGDEQGALRDLHIDSVMDEQERQFEEGIEDAWAIAETCRRTSAKGAIIAYITAKKDERAAFGAYMKMDSDYNLLCVPPSPTSMDRATVKSYFATSDMENLSTPLLITPAA
ncbi:unnamed protein product [Cylindrotheca closterium]|uniref:Uncharacterized protein n=1 Tax=Cylindrotheca closterium TaxID=2856 RepID=A0AAD2CIH7_9STRA|nr:unnamed protein product [Cylindrotheca closterium]